MGITTERLSARDVIYDLIPKLKATQHLVDNTLRVKIARYADEGERARLESLKLEFELEISMIRMNLDHLLTRYSRQLEEAAKGGEGDPGPMLELDEHEAVAIESARRLYRRAHELQAGLRDWGVP